MRQKPHAKAKAQAAHMQRWVQQVSRQLATAPCLLCYATETTMLGIFIPNDPQAYGAAQGKTRYIAYSLCSACAAWEGKLPAIEGAVQAQIRRLQAQWN